MRVNFGFYRLWRCRCLPRPRRVVDVVKSLHAADSIVICLASASAIRGRPFFPKSIVSNVGQLYADICDSGTFFMLAKVYLSTVSTSIIDTHNSPEDKCEEHWENLPKMLARLDRHALLLRRPPNVMPRNEHSHYTTHISTGTFGQMHFTSFYIVCSRQCY